MRFQDESHRYDRNNDNSDGHNGSHDQWPDKTKKKFNKHILKATTATETTGIAQGAIKCTHGKDERTIAIQDKEGGCETIYTKSGEPSAVATSNSGKQYCQNVETKIEKHLTDAGLAASNHMRYGIVLSGGGARGAYQAGSLRALYEICRDAGNLSPFQTLIGLSAGAVNAAFLAAEIEDLDYATNMLCQVWRQLQSKDVIRTDPFSMSKTAFKVVRQLSLGGISGWLRANQLSLLNTSPLAKLLKEKVRFDNIEKNVADKRLHAFCVTATDYSTSLGVTFFTGDPEIQEWTRVHRRGIRSKIGVDHVMASSAIPLFFPPWPIEDRFFGDGCLRNTAPLAPAIHCGANRLIVLGVRRWKEVDLIPETNIRPSLGRVLSVLINAIMMDGIETDIERIRIINRAMESVPTSAIRQIDVFYSKPSSTLSDIAAGHADALPPILRFLIAGLGSREESAEIISYLAFVPEYASTLVNMGYSDVMADKDKLIHFLTHS